MFSTTLSRWPDAGSWISGQVPASPRSPAPWPVPRPCWRANSNPFAVAAIELNATANDVSIAVTGDVLGGTGEDAQVVLAADIWYEQRLAQRALGLLQRARARGADVLIGDIGRTFLPRSLMRERAAYDVPVIADLEDAAVKRVLVLTLR